MTSFCGQFNTICSSPQIQEVCCSHRQLKKNSGYEPQRAFVYPPDTKTMECIQNISWDVKSTARLLGFAGFLFTQLPLMIPKTQGKEKSCSSRVDNMPHMEIGTRVKHWYLHEGWSGQRPLPSDSYCHPEQTMDQWTLGSVSGVLGEALERRRNGLHHCQMYFQFYFILTLSLLFFIHLFPLDLYFKYYVITCFFFQFIDLQLEKKDTVPPINLQIL